VDIRGANMVEDPCREAAVAPTLYSRPLETISLFSKYMASVLYESMKRAAVNPVTKFIVYPAFVCYIAMKALGLFPDFVREAEVRSNLK
jgi:uncharacterized membrane protein YGL010W